jgi:hypothetical protein
MSMGDVTGFLRTDGIDGCVHHAPLPTGLTEPWPGGGGILL